MIKVALVEISNSHSECMYSQVKILKSVPDLELTLIGSFSIQKSVELFDLVDNKVFFSTRNGAASWIDIFKIWRYCISNKFDFIIFNSAQGTKILHLVLFPYHRKTKLVGLLHNVSKLFISFNQKIISKRLNKYFYLNEYLKLPNDIKHKFSEFHPIFFPTYTKVDTCKNDNDIWICIPGSVENFRRDYTSLFESIEQYGIESNIKFLLLGKSNLDKKDGMYVNEQIEKLSLQDHFITWNGFIDESQFYSFIEDSNYILPLIHSKHYSGKLYKNQISGAFNLAAGFKKAMIVEEEFSKSKFDKYPIITYNDNNLMLKINSLVNSKDEFAYTDIQWTFEYQRNKYLKFLGIEC